MLCIHRSEPGVNERLRELARNMLCDYDKDKNKGSKIPTYRIYTYMMLLFFFLCAPTRHDYTIIFSKSVDVTARRRRRRQTSHYVFRFCT